jgi:flagellar FliJ protein
MVAPATLETLIDLARQENEAASRRLGSAQRQLDDARQKLALLEQYRDDYATRGTSRLASGINSEHLNNYWSFMQKLEQAIAGQQKIVEETHHRHTQARTEWQESERKKQSFMTLAARSEKTALQRENRHDQKQNDEFANRNRPASPAIL